MRHGLTDNLNKKTIMQIKPFTVDGHTHADPDSDLQGDGQFPPFYVFDQNNQVNIAGPFPTRERAEQERVALSHKHGVPLHYNHD